ncbi:MAG: hypothetical protein LIO97_00975 [Tannerellaceae bacterium]|nr:hypothetical protein [Tannerellaceae bacterium]
MLFLKKFASHTDAGGDEQFLSSVVHRLNDLKPMLKLIMEQEAAGSTSCNKLRLHMSMLQNLFDNNFNDLIHTTLYKKMLKDVGQLLLTALTAYKENFERINQDLRKYTSADKKRTCTSIELDRRSC